MENNEDKQIDLKVVENKLMKIAALDFNIEERKVEEKMIGVLDQYKAEQKKIKSQKMNSLKSFFSFTNNKTKTHVVLYKN